MSTTAKPVRFGGYLLLERVATGDMAEVYKARARGGGPFVALQRIHAALATDEAFVRTFLQEARVAQQLRHPHIARILEAGQVGQSPFVTMEYVHGRDLRAVLQRMRERGERIPPAMACLILMKVCEGLHHAHDKRDEEGEPLHLVHRGLAPQSILVSKTGEVKLVDFGVAKAAAKATTGTLKGKLGYMSPEQVRGLPLDRRSDVFAAGIVLYELLTGERPFVGATDFSTLERIRNVDVEPPRAVVAELPPELERIVLAAMARDPDDRPPTAMDLHDALQGHLYSSGSIFGPGDLSRWLLEVFSRELEAESIREEQYRLLEEEMADDRDKLGGPDTERQPKVPERGAGGGAKGSSGRKRTMVGMGAPAAPPSQGGPNLGEWDDDDMATQVYDKSQHGPLSPGSTPPPAPERPSTPPPTPAKGRTGPPASSPEKAPRPSQPAAEQAAPLRTSVPPPRPRRAGPDPATQPRDPAASVEVREEPPLRGDPTVEDRPGTRPEASPQEPPRNQAPPPRRRRPRERTELIERPQSSNRGTYVALGAMGLLMLLGLGIGAYAVLGPKTPGTIQLVTEPPDATVLLDEQPVAATSSPYVIRNVAPDTVHLLEVRMEGYRPWSMQVDLHPGEVLEVPPVQLRPVEGAAARPEALEGAEPAADEEAEVEDKGPAPKQADDGMQIVHFHSRPEGARVEIERGDERRVVGFTPTWGRMTVDGGPWTVRISNMGYETWEQQVELPGGDEKHRVRANLSRKGGTRAAPRRTARPRPRPKTQPEQESPPKAQAQAAAAEPEAEPEAEAKAEPEASEASEPAKAEAEGTLRVSTRPWTNVSVGGRDIGATPQMNISLPPGKHTVRLTNPEFGIDETLTVEIEAGRTVTKILNLTSGE